MRYLKWISAYNLTRPQWDIHIHSAVCRGILQDSQEDWHPPSSSHGASLSWRSKVIISGSAPELQQPNCDIRPLYIVCSGWLAAAQAQWSKNHRNTRAQPRDKSPCPTSGECGKISRKKPSHGWALNWDLSVVEPGARRAAKRNRACGCLRGKRNSWTGYFRRRSRTYAALRRHLLRETSLLEATRSPGPAATGSLCYSLLAQLLGPRGANRNWWRTEAQNSPCPSWWCTSRRAPLSAQRASRSWWWTRPLWWERRSSCVKTQVILWVKTRVVPNAPSRVSTKMLYVFFSF